MASFPLINHHCDPSFSNSAVVVEPSPTPVSTPNSLVVEPSFTPSSADISSLPLNKSNKRSSVTPFFDTSGSPSSKSVNRWSSSEVRMLIEQVGKHQHSLQQVKDPREKGRIWNRIISIIQNSDLASSALKNHTKASIQQKGDSLLQKYRDIKDRIISTGEEAVQNDWEFFNDMDKYLSKDPSITASVTSDSISGIKHKEKDTIEIQEEEAVFNEILIK
ncbi:18726_t:CDS:2 [Funneliformis geosporum]|nr:18726_t:CDS:2 [Funneliformis geosporum]